MDRKRNLVIGVGFLVVIIVILVVVLVVRSQSVDSSIDLTTEEQESMRIGGKEADNIEAEESKEFPILKWIPYVVDEYSDDMMTYTHYEIWPEYSNNDFTVVIRDYTGGNEVIANNKIENWGVKLSDYKIQYEDLSTEYGSVKVSDD